MERRRASLADTLLVWGFVASFFGLFGAAFFEAFKIFAVVPHAFESAPGSWQNPMTADEDTPPAHATGTRMTPEQRAQYGGRSEQPPR